MKSRIDYKHSQNSHSLEGPLEALPIFFSHEVPVSLLDIGCGEGSWLKAAGEFGIQDVYGIDGVNIPQNRLLFDPKRFRQCDLTRNIELGRKYDVAICLEVAEHIDGKYAAVLIDTLTKHTDKVLFSAACPSQPGQYHVNCQWPVYWQKLFNDAGFECSDSLRLKIWDNPKIEVWYRQNIFVATRSSEAGRESRIESIIHPEMQECITNSKAFSYHIREIENGRMPASWYIKMPIRALWQKIKRTTA